MRQLGRSVIRLRQMRDKSKANLANFLDSRTFDAVVSAVREECKFIPSNEQVIARLNMPSLALKIGH